MLSQNVPSSPLAQAVFASLVDEMVQMFPLHPQDPQKGGLYRSTKTGLFVLYDSTELTFYAMESAQDYGIILQCAMEKVNDLTGSKPIVSHG